MGTYLNYVCGKCEGTEWYPGVQVMNSGVANWFTKRVEVPMCKVCDIPMRQLKARGPLFWVVIGFFGFVALAAALQSF
jgi:hypothetical protein